MFSFFRKTTVINTHKLIKITLKKEGSHGDAWRAVYGADMSVEKLLHMISELLDKPPVWNDDKLKKCVENVNGIVVTAVGLRGKLASAYPFLEKNQQMILKTKVIMPWSHVNGVEAEIGGELSFGGGVNFFATDYLQNKNFYHSNLEINIALSALAYDFGVQATVHEKFSNDFVSYMYYGGDQTSGVYWFIGKVLSVHKYVSENIVGSVVDISLVQKENNENLFILPIFVNEILMKNENIKFGMKVEGHFWLSGRLAN